VEFAELTADHDYLSQITQLASGSLASLTDVHGIIDRFGAAKETLKSATTSSFGTSGRSSSSSSVASAWSGILRRGTQGSVRRATV